MADVHDKHTRSYNMSQIRCKDTKPEMLVRKFLFRNGYRYRIHDKSLPGKPDIVLPKFKTVIMINGCFWHGHDGCKYFVIPKSRSEWWKRKINATKTRDHLNMRSLDTQGWRVINVWECELKPQYRIKTLSALLDTLQDK